MSKQLTKSDLRLIYKQWDTRTVNELAEQIGCTTATIYKVARVMREAGLEVTMKKRHGSRDLLIKEFISEL